MKVPFGTSAVMASINRHIRKTYMKNEEAKSAGGDTNAFKHPDTGRPGMLITPSRFNAILDATISKMRTLTASKGAEYKQGSVDQLANFKRGAERQKVHALVIWRVYFDKHLDSIIGWVNDIRDRVNKTYSEPITERIDDCILYLVLLKAFYVEMNPSKEVEFYAGMDYPHGHPANLGGVAISREPDKFHKFRDGPQFTLRERIYIAIGEERKHQDAKYGDVLIDTAGPTPIQGSGGHELGAWLVILERELEEAKSAVVHGGNHAKGRDTIRAELVQIAAVCVAALEQHGLE